MEVELKEVQEYVEEQQLVAPAVPTYLLPPLDHFNLDVLRVSAGYHTTERTDELGHS